MATLQAPIFLTSLTSWRKYLSFFIFLVLSSELLVFRFDAELIPILELYLKITLRLK